MNRRVLSAVFLTAVLVVVWSVPAFADLVSYIERSWDGSKVVSTDKQVNATPVTSNTTSFTNNGWYVVKTNVEINERINVSGTANLILADGATLTNDKGIEVAEGNTLNIYGQANDTGTFSAYLDENSRDPANGAAIGGGGDYSSVTAPAGTITIHGGTITADGGSNGAGIGGGDNGSGGTITIYGGSVIGDGGNDGAGIGGGYNGSGGIITIYGGTVEGYGSASWGAGIGGGNGGSGGTITIYGGSVTAKGIYSAAGIGGGNGGKGENITINGGTVDASGGGAGIGGGRYCSGGIITINGGTVTTEGDPGIGGGTAEAITINGGTVKSRGYSVDSNSIVGEKVNIYGGNVTANGLSVTAGIVGEIITLSWSSLTDFIKSNTYSGTVTVLPGKIFTDDEGGLYFGSIGSRAAGKTIVPATSAALYVSRDIDASNNVISQDRVITNFVAVTSDTVSWNDGTWYFANGEVTVPERITVTGTANLILADGAILSASKGINVASGDTLNIYGQTGGTGTLTATGSDGAGIGGSDGTFAGSIKIYGGTVDATGGDGSAGIGSGCYGKGGITTIYGGVVNATGIGDGYQPESSGTTAIYGGVVTASADSGVGINGTTILSWSSLTDSITASSYSGTVTTIFGKIFTVNNSETTYHGELNNDSIGGKTLVPAENAYLAELIDVELAKLSPDNFTVCSKSIAVTAGKTVTVTVIPSEGYNGTMTVTDAEGNNVSVTEKGGNKFDFTMPASKASIKAGTTLKNYPITYNLNMGSVSGNPESYTIESNAITLNNPTRNGYNFNGWTGTGLDGKTQNVVIPTGSTGERSYTANWTPITYTVSYNLDGGTVSGNPTSYTIETAAFTLKKPTRTGYTFTGWTGMGLTTATETVTVNKGSTGNRAYTATWTPAEYTINYTLNGGTVAKANPVKYSVESSDFTLNNPTKKGYTFTGWTSTGITTATTTVKIAKGSTGNRTYSATWTPITYTVSYNLDGGTVSGNPTSYTIETATFTLKNPTKTGYTFAGWTGTKLSKATKTVKVAKESTGKRTYTATWKLSNYAITYKLNSGKVAKANPSSYSMTSKDFTLNNPTRSGYTFAGWTGTGLDKITKTLTVKEGSTGKKTFTANWVRLKGSLANGVIKTAYSANITVDGYKAAPYNWSIANLPDGLEFETDGHTAVVSGKPTRAGTYKVKITAKDANKLALSKTFTVKITQPAITGTFSENGSVGQNYIGSATVSGGTAPYTWTYSGVPAGLSVDISGAKISLSGKPTTAKSYNFKVTAKDKNKVSVSKTFAIKITKPTITGLFGAGVVKTEYSGSATVAGGTAPYSWTYSGVPAGLKVNVSGATISLSGKPTTAKSYKFKVTAKDKNKVSVSKTFTIKVTKPAITGTFGAGTVGVEYSGSAKVSGGTAPYTWSIRGVPAGLDFEMSSNTVKLSGKPETAGTFSMKLTAKDASGLSVSKTFKIKITASTSAKENSSSESESNDTASESEMSETSDTITAKTPAVTGNGGIIAGIATELRVVSDDIVSKGEERDEDLIEVNADKPVKFIIGQWVSSNGSRVNVKADEVSVYVDDKAQMDIVVADDGTFTLPAGLVHDDFKVQAKAGELETVELFIIPLK